MDKLTDPKNIIAFYILEEYVSFWSKVSILLNPLKLRWHISKDLRPNKGSKDSNFHARLVCRTREG